MKPLLDERLKMMTTGKVLKHIDGTPVVLCKDGAIRFIGDMDIDSDGGPNVDHDPCWQKDTTLRFKGKSINSQQVPYIVCPQGILNLVGPIGLGCHCNVVHLTHNKEAAAVCADLGPYKKTGEGSAALARLLGVNPNSVRGGEDAKVILYEMYLGVPAKVNGITYDLQPLHSH